MIIIPAILEKDFVSAKNKIGKLSPYFNRFQIDIADGKAVPNKTFETKDFRPEEFPNLTFDFHLMVKNPEKELEVLENKPNVKVVFVNFVSFKENFLEKYSIKYGVVLNPADKPEEFLQKSFSKKINHLLIMTVNPGFQGSSFLPEMLEKIKVLRKLGFKGKIYLDGGINEKTIKKILPYRKEIFGLCIGSYFTKAKNPEENLKVLKSLLSNTP